MSYAAMLQDKINILVRLNAGTVEAPKRESIILRNVDLPTYPGGAEGVMAVINAIATIVKYPVVKVDLAITGTIEEL